MRMRCKRLSQIEGRALRQVAAVKPASAAKNKPKSNTSRLSQERRHILSARHA